MTVRELIRSSLIFTEIIFTEENLQNFLFNPTDPFQENLLGRCLVSCVAFDLVFPTNELIRNLNNRVVKHFYVWKDYLVIEVAPEN